MTAGELINQIVDDKAKKEVIETTELVDGLTKSILAAVAASREFGENIKNAKGSTALTNASKAAAAADLLRAKAQKELEAALLLKAKAEDIAVKASERTAKQSQSTEKATRSEQKAIDDLKDDYILLVKARDDAARKARQYAASLGLEHEVTQRAVASHKALNDRVVAINRSLGNFRDNVGNYASGVTNIQRQIAMFAGELPNVQYGLRTFASSLSNQFQGLFDAIKMARLENMALRAEGKPTVSVAKQIVGSVFNWQTALLGLVAAGGALIQHLEKAEKKNEEYEESIRKVTKALQEQIKEENDFVRLEGNRQDIGSAAAKRRLDLLIAQGASEKEIAKARNEYYDLQVRELTNDKSRYQAIKDRINLVGDEFRAREQMLKLNEGELNKPFIAETKKTLQENLRLTDEEAQKQAEAIVNTFRKNNSVINREYRAQITELDERIKDVENQRRVDEARANRPSAADNARERRLAKEREELAMLAEQARILKASLDFSTNILPEIDPELLQQPLRTFEAGLKELDLAEQQRITLLEQSYAAGVTTLEDYEQQKAAIVQEYALKRAEATVSFLNEELNTEGLTVDQKLELQKRLNAALADLGKIRTENEKKANKNQVADAKKSAKEKEEAERKRIESLKAYMEAAAGVISNAFGIVGDQMDANLQKFQPMIDAINSQRDAEIDAVNQSVLSQQDKEKKIAEIEAKARARQQNIEQQEIQARRKKAAFDKAAAIAQIILNTAQSVTAALTSIPPNVPLAISNGIIGAAQLARAIAAPLPQYAEGAGIDGKPVHPGGAALYGEAGPELVIEPGKRPRVVNEPTIGNLARGTKVIPYDYLQKMAYNFILPQKKQEKADYSDIVNASDRTRRDVVRAIVQSGSAKKEKRSPFPYSYYNNWINGRK